MVVGKGLTHSLTHSRRAYLSVASIFIIFFYYYLVLKKKTPTVAMAALGATEISPTVEKVAHGATGWSCEKKKEILQHH